MREIKTAASLGDSDALLALDVYIHHLATGIAAMSASLGGLDLLAFTAGVGEHSPEVRRRCAEQLSYLGGAVDAARSFATTSDRDITHAGAGVQALVIAAREDLQIAGKPVDSAHASRANSGEGADAW